MNDAPGARVRAAAAEALAAVRFDGVSLKAALPAALAQLPDARDRALCEAICFEGCRWALRYERLLVRLLERPLPRALQRVHALLLAGLAQLDAMQLTPYAAISSSAEAARLLGHPRHVGLVNAVLRRYARESDALQQALRDDAEAQHAHPAWLARRLQQDWAELAPELLARNNVAAPMWLRVNRRRIERDDYLKTLAAAGIEATPCDFAPQAVRLAQGIAAPRLPGWDDGLVSVQDLAAQLAAEALDARCGERVLDACAAPGGKAAHVLEREDVALLAIDADPRRLQRVEETLRRLRLAATLQVADAAASAGWWDGVAFDRILLDAPCSATGVIRRQPDIRLHRRATDIAPLVALQARLLDATWPLLRPGGRLVYATCSLLKDENERQIDAFLARTADADAVALAPHFGRPAGRGRQRLPGDDDGDGFFHAALAKRA